MDAVDLAADLRVIAPDDPCGPDLEFDPDFAEFERLAQGKPEQQYGSTIVPAEEPDWKDLVARGAALGERTLDLRVMAQFAVARLQREGPDGFAAVLATIRAVLEAHWEAVHPRLDPEDDHDPTMRANALLLLREPVRVLRALRQHPLARSSRAGAVSWRDVMVAEGTLEPEEGRERLSAAEVAAAFRETDQGQLARLRDVLGGAAADVAAIPAAFDAQAGHGSGPDLDDLLKLLRDMRRLLVLHAPQAAADPEPAEEAPAAAGATGGEAPAPARGGGMSVAALGAVTSRADALRLMDLVVEYFERHEPGSPLPLLIGRARRLADKGFLDLLRDLAPDGLGQAEMVVGPRPE